MQIHRLLFPIKIILILLICSISNDIFSQTIKENQAEIQKIKTKYAVLETKLDDVSKSLILREKTLKKEIKIFKKERSEFKINQSYYTAALSNQTSLETKLDSISKSLTLREKTLKNEVNAFKKELFEFKSNQSYFTTALSSQTAIFSIIVSVMLGLLAFISYSRYKHELEKIGSDTDDKLVKHEARIEKLQEKLKEGVSEKLETELTNFQNIQTSTVTEVEKLFLDQESKFLKLKKEMELAAQASLKKQESSFKKLMLRISLKIKALIIEHEVKFKGIESNAELNMGTLLSAQNDDIAVYRAELEENLDRQLQEQKAEFESFGNRMKQLEKITLSTTANSYLTITNTFFDQEEWNYAFLYSFSILFARKKLYSLYLDSKKKEKEIKRIIYILKRINNQILKKIETSIDLKSKIRADENYYLESLDSLYNMDNEEIKKLVAETRVNLSKICKT